MKRCWLVLCFCFAGLTFVGVGYVLLNKGMINAGYAVVPMVLTFAFLQLYRSHKL